MKFEIEQYNLVLVDESNYSSNSTDNLFQYEQHYKNEQEYRPRTQIGVKLYDGENIISNSLISSTGGASGIHKTSQTITNNSITICCADSVFNLSIPRLKLQWMSKADDATCFQIFKYKEDFIIHGELNITRLSSNGEIMWQNSGADIFITEKGEENFELKNEIITVKDWNNHLYKFNMDGKPLTK